MNYETLEKKLNNHILILNNLIEKGAIDINELDKIIKDASQLSKEKFNFPEKEIKQLNKKIEEITEKIEILKKVIIEKIQELQFQEKATISYLKNLKF